MFDAHHGKVRQALHSSPNVVRSSDKFAGLSPDTHDLVLGLFSQQWEPSKDGKEGGCTSAISCVARSTSSFLVRWPSQMDPCTCWVKGVNKQGRKHSMQLRSRRSAPTKLLAIPLMLKSWLTGLAKGSLDTPMGTVGGIGRSLTVQ